MHRSGTSVLARLLNMMGAYFGPEGSSTGANSENPKGFWERRDIRDINDMVLLSLSCDWDKLSNFDLNRLSPEILAKFNDLSSKTLLDMDGHRPWMLKEPRFCLLFPLWRKLLEFPVCIHIYRNPLEVAKSLNKRNNTPINVGIALWERYVASAVNASMGLPNILISHEQLMENPAAVVENLYSQLSSFGVTGIRMPSSSEISAFVDPTLHREHDTEQDFSHYLNINQMQLFDRLLNCKIFDGNNPLVISKGGILSIEHYEQTEQAHEISNKNITELERTQNAAFENIAELERTQNTAFENIAELERAQNTAKKATIKLNNQLEQKNLVIKQSENKINQLNNISTQLIHGINALTSSRRWIFGDFVFSLRHKIMGRPTTLPANKYISEVISRYELEKEKKISSTEIYSPTYINETEENDISFPLLREMLTVDIIVCVHNALEDVKKCLNSIISNTQQDYNLLIVNDGSNTDTTILLKKFVAKYKHARLFDNATTQGYTKSANIGLRASSADYVVLLNSDTIVPQNWLMNILECGESDSKIGIISTLSNAASWQSVPERYDENGDWAVNPLPNGIGISEMSELVYQISDHEFPRVPIVNGFCFAIKRPVIDRIGYLDEDAFPKGYGEENDYCIRTGNNGFSLAIADHTYIYHSKSKSYSHERRTKLAAQGDLALQKKHGSSAISRAVDDLRNNPALARVRKSLSNFLNGENLALDNAKIHILFFLPVSGIGGGIHSILQEALGMRNLGVNAQIATPANYESDYITNFPELNSVNALFFFYRDEKTLERKFHQSDLVVATTYASPEIIASMVGTKPNIRTAYYIQDYEPLFFEPGSENWNIAKRSYTLIPNMLLFAKTQWICDTVNREHNVEVQKVIPSLDSSVFNINSRIKENSEPTKIAAMIRPSSPRRSAQMTMQILKRCKEKYEEAIKIEVFGCIHDELNLLDNNFVYHNHEILTKASISKLYQSADIFVDFSEYQAFGRTGLEAMACGCSTILPEEGGVHEYAIDHENSLIVDTKSELAMSNALETLINNAALRLKLQKNGLLTANNYNIPRTVLSELSLFRQKLTNKRLNAKTSSNYSSTKLRLSLLLAVRGDGKPSGSAHIRLLQPLLHTSVQKKVQIEIRTIDQLMQVTSGAIVIQRASVPDTSTARKLIRHCEKNKLRLALEIDDDLLNIRKKKGNDVSFQQETLNALKLIAKAAGLIVVSSPLLADSFKEFNKNIICVPNAHDENIWLEQANEYYIRPNNIAKTEYPIRILYMGTRTHLHDLDIVKDAFKKINEEYGNRVVLDVVGGIPDGTRHFGNSVNPENIDTNSDAYTDFVKWFRNSNCWAFGIIPLETTLFNRKKSYIKYLDYSSLGIASICSDIEPYQSVVRDGENGLLVSNETQTWHQAIKLLIEDNTYRDKLARNAFHDLANKYILKQRAKYFYQAYNSNYGINSCID